MKEEKLLPIHKFGFKISTLSKNAHASSQVSNLFDSVCPYFDNWGLEFGSVFLLLWFARLSVCTVESYYSLLDMNCLSWNCRGIGNSRTVRALHSLVQQYNPNIVFLMETKIGAKKNGEG